MHFLVYKLNILLTLMKIMLDVVEILTSGGRVCAYSCNRYFECIVESKEKQPG